MAPLTPATTPSNHCLEAAAAHIDLCPDWRAPTAATWRRRASRGRDAHHISPSRRPRATHPMHQCVRVRPACKAREACADVAAASSREIAISQSLLSWPSCPAPARQTRRTVARARRAFRPHPPSCAPPRLLAPHTASAVNVDATSMPPRARQAVRRHTAAYRSLSALGCLLMPSALPALRRIKVRRASAQSASTIVIPCSLGPAAPVSPHAPLAKEGWSSMAANRACIAPPVGCLLRHSSAQESESAPCCRYSSPCPHRPCCVACAITDARDASAPMPIAPRAKPRAMRSAPRHHGTCLAPGHRTWPLAITRRRAYATTGGASRRSGERRPRRLTHTRRSHIAALLDRRFRDAREGTHPPPRRRQHHRLGEEGRRGRSASFLVVSSIR